MHNNNGMLPVSGDIGYHFKIGQLGYTKAVILHIDWYVDPIYGTVKDKKPLPDNKNLRCIIRQYSAVLATDDLNNNNNNIDSCKNSSYS